VIVRTEAGVPTRWTPGNAPVAGVTATAGGPGIVSQVKVATSVDDTPSSLVTVRVAVKVALALC
jgi:hypothetical protein